MSKRYGPSNRRLLESRRKRSLARSKKTRKNGRVAPPKIAATSSEPRVVFTRDKDGRMTVELSSATGIADKLGKDTFLAFVRCFAGLDRFLALQLSTG